MFMLYSQIQEVVKDYGSCGQVQQDLSLEVGLKATHYTALIKKMKGLFIRK